MNNLSKYLFNYMAFAILLFNSCTESFEPKTNTFENVLIVESTITNEFNNQIVKLSNTIKIEEDVFNPTRNAQIWIGDSNNNNFYFSEIKPGTYTSDIEFKAEPTTEYKLHIITQVGHQYESRIETLTPKAPISNLYALKETFHGELGIQIYIDNINISSNPAKYFRYEFIETNKVISLFYIHHDIRLFNIEILRLPPFIKYDIDITETQEEKRICYTTNKHQKIIQSDVLNAPENNLTKFPIRFINKNDALIRDRYSILVKQYVQNFDSYNFYRILNDVGSVESLISETQTGFVQGNMISTSTNSEKIFGYFDVSTVSEKRIYFDYSDFGFRKPKYPFIPILDTLDYRDMSFQDNQRQKLYQHTTVRQPFAELVDVLPNIIEPNPNIFVIINAECGNCTTFSSKIKPEFWID